MDLTAKYVSYLKHTHKINETLAYCPWKMTKKHLARVFSPPIIYPNTASSETKQLEAEI